MSKAILESLNQERQDVEALVTRTLENVEEGRDLNEAEVRTIEEAKKRLEAIDKTARPIADYMATRSAAIDLQAYIARAENHKLMTQRDQQAAVRSETRMSDFVDSEQYRAWGGHGKSSVYDVDGFSARAVLVESAAPGSLLLPNREKILLNQGEVQRPLLSAIGHLQVSQNSIDMVTYGDPKGATGFAKVPENTAKPEATITATTATVNLATIAAWVAASRQLLEDAPAARGLIDGQLRRGYFTALETEAAAVIAAGTYTDTTGATGQSLLEVARIGMAEVAEAGFTPESLVVAPADAAAFDLFLLSQTTLGAITGQGVWGLNVIPVTGVTTPMIGDFKTAVVWLERTGVAIYVSDSHASTFISNTFTILCEGRSGFVVAQPAAIRTLTVTP
jgi:HK97 family phage major capsid protein